MEFDLLRRKEDAWLSSSQRYLDKEEILTLGYDPKEFIGVEYKATKEGKTTIHYTFFSKQKSSKFEVCHMKRRDDDVKI